jgi:hypothetical protein
MKMTRGEAASVCARRAEEYSKEIMTILGFLFWGSMFFAAIYATSNKFRDKEKVTLGIVVAIIWFIFQLTN